LSGDDDGVACVGAETPSEREDFEQSLITLQLMNSWRCDCAENRNTLAVHLCNGNGDVGVDQDLREAFRDGSFKLVRQESGGLELADYGEINVAAAIDKDGLVVDLLETDRADEDLVAGTESIVVIQNWNDRG